MTLILNTWIFENDVKKGVSQVDLVKRVAALGADGIEVRREYFKDFDVELAAVAKAARENDLIVNYSVPDVIFEADGTILSCHNTLRKASRWASPKSSSTLATSQATMATWQKI